MPTVYNKHTGCPPDAVYIGRPSKWGNPYSFLHYTPVEFKVHNRQQAVDAFESYILNNSRLLADAKSELAGKDLVCWCAPAACHGDILLEIANDWNADNTGH